MRLSKKVKLYLLENGGSTQKQKETATELALLAPQEYTTAVLTGKSGVAIGADLLTPAELSNAFEQELSVICWVRAQLRCKYYFNAPTADKYLSQLEVVFTHCIDQLREAKE